MKVSLQNWTARIAAVAVLTACCGFSEMAAAQAAQPPAQPTQQEATPAAPQASDTQSATPQQSTQQNAPTGVVDPSAGPLTPVPSTQPELPSAPSSSRDTQANAPTAPTGQRPEVHQPVGAAGAQVGPTAGGAASKPAGNAIAPAKQRQTRSFLIKMGMVAAAGVAIGTIVALSRGTSGNPPGAR